jgi:hypothetical protein
MTMDHKLSFHRTRQVIQCRDAMRVVARCLMEHEDVALLFRQCLNY